MASWFTHLIIANEIAKQLPQLDKHSFCVGNIAPDCNIENDNWTAFTPSREITHWMSGEIKSLSDCDRFYNEYIVKRKDEIKSNEQYSFLLGYYSHLVTDALFHLFVRDKQRVKAIWKRIKADETLKECTKGYVENFDSVKKIISKDKRLHEIYVMEAEYLRDNQDSNYLIELMNLKEFPDYIDYLPKGCIARKIRIMGYVPELDASLINPIAISRDEFKYFNDSTAFYIINKCRELCLV